MIFEGMLLERIMRLDKRACIRIRRDFSSDSQRRWYLDMGSVVICSPTVGGWCSITNGGATPEEAILDAWKLILTNSTQDRFFLRYHCEPSENVPGNGPQVWVRWSQEKDDWEDYAPTEQALIAHHIPADRIRPYADHARGERI